MSNPFPAGKRPWLRITAAKRAISDLILGKGELAITDTGDVIVGNGANELKNRPALLDQAAAQQTYVTYDGNYLRKNGIAVELPSTGIVITENGDGTLTSTSSAFVDNGNGTISA
jgi:hypothetical protein